MRKRKIPSHLRTPGRRNRHDKRKDKHITAEIAELLVA